MTKQEFWMHVYIAAVRAGNSSSAEHMADNAMRNFELRFGEK